MSMVLLEAAMAGKAIVCTTVGESSELLRHGETAMLVEPGDLASMADALTLLVQDAGLRDRLGDAAASELQQQCSAKAMVARYSSLYLRVLALTGGTRLR